MELYIKLTTFQIDMLADLVDQKCEELEEELESDPDDYDLLVELHEWYDLSQNFVF